MSRGQVPEVPSAMGLRPLPLAAEASGIRKRLIPESALGGKSCPAEIPILPFAPPRPVLAAVEMMAAMMVVVMWTTPPVEAMAAMVVLLWTTPPV